ncbi:hypothetical protein [Spiroplasma phoeniceum]|uniref:hypothetical protein n=1 Tax=Spiroplasma phoeniceum TaxID=47835 RepID=UPI000DF7A30D|nr:hypothetical protein [Spiroplasma phoeniceum]
MYSDLTNIDLAKLQEYIIQLYKNFKITADTNLKKLSRKDYPILTDLYNLVYQKEQDTLLEKMLWKLTKGADGTLFNFGTPITRNPALPTLLIARGFGLMFVFRSGEFMLVILIAINITNINSPSSFFFFAVP